MANLAAIVGDVGTGKSTSVQHFDPKETYIINVAGKALPFKGSNKIYNRENKNYDHIENTADVLSKLRTISDAKHIKRAIIDDANYLMGFNMVDKATETGYTKFSKMAQDMKNLVQGAKTLRDDLIIFYLCHLEEIEDNGEIVTYKMKTAGKLVDKEIKLDGLFTIVLYTSVEEKAGKAEYFFVTNRYKKLPAKSPMGMFDEIKIPNNLKIVEEKIREYYS